MRYRDMEVRLGNTEIRQRALVADERDSLAIARIGTVGCIDGKLVQSFRASAVLVTQVSVPLPVSPVAVARAPPRRISCRALDEQQRSQIRFKVPNGTHDGDACKHWSGYQPGVFYSTAVGESSASLGAERLLNG